MNRVTITGLNLGLSEQHDSNGRWIGVEVSSESPLTTSDGYHTIDELYDHRITLFIALCRQVSQQPYTDEARYGVWRSKTHFDCTSLDGWFILGIGKIKGTQITYHLPLSRWEETSFADTLERAPKFDGHTSADVLERLEKL